MGLRYPNIFDPIWQKPSIALIDDSIWSHLSRDYYMPVHRVHLEISSGSGRLSNLANHLLYFLKPTVFNSCGLGVFKKYLSNVIFNVIKRLTLRLFKSVDLQTSAYNN